MVGSEAGIYNRWTTAGWVAIDVAKAMHQMLTEAPEPGVVYCTCGQSSMRLSSGCSSSRSSEVGFEPTGDYHRPIAYWLGRQGFVRLHPVSSIAVTRTRAVAGGRCSRCTAVACRHGRLRRKARPPPCTRDRGHVSRPPPFAPQQHQQPPIAKTDACLRQLPQTLSKRGLWIPMALVSHARDQGAHRHHPKLVRAPIRPGR